MADSNDLLEKIAKLNDLRQAIKLVQDAAVKKNDQSTQSKDSPDSSSKELKLGGIQHMKTDIDSSGVIHHFLGDAGSKHGYKISVDVSKDRPQMIIQHLEGDEPKSFSSKIHNTIDSAVKSIMHHFYNKEWKE